MSPIKIRRLESGIRLVVELYEALSNHRIEEIKALLSDDVIFETSAGQVCRGERIMGIEEIERGADIFTE